MRVCLHMQARNNRTGRKIRNGRKVSRTPCRHARSIHDCPHGPERCWFWHIEDSGNEDSSDEDSSDETFLHEILGAYGL